ncbi:MAG: hypothetical protein ACLSFO_00200 [Anaerovoracaceae bacterium]
MRNVYLDYSATPVKDEVLKEMIPYFTEKFGNPSACTTKDWVKDAVTARTQVAVINAKPGEIFSLTIRVRQLGGVRLAS